VFEYNEEEKMHNFFSFSAYFVLSYFGEKKIMRCEELKKAKKKAGIKNKEKVGRWVFLSRGE